MCYRPVPYYVWGKRGIGEGSLKFPMFWTGPQKPGPENLQILDSWHGYQKWDSTHRVVVGCWLVKNF